MKTATIALAIACMAFGMPIGAKSPHDHHPSHTSHAAPSGRMPIPAKRYATDAPLREGMHRIHDALAKLDHDSMGHLSNAMAHDQIAEIREAVAFMFANCKLAEEPDQVLHSMLIPLLAAAQNLESDPTDARQVDAMQHAVVDYPRYFEDSGWPELETHENPGAR